MRTLLLALLAVSWLGAHELLFKTEGGRAVVCAFSFPDGTPFSYEKVEVYPPEGDVPHAHGFTDRNGRFAFVPDAPGAWSVKAISEDGHGGTYTVEVDQAMKEAEGGRSFFDQFTRLLVGVGLILGLFALYQFTRRKKS